MVEFNNWWLRIQTYFNDNKYGINYQQIKILAHFERKIKVLQLSQSPLYRIKRSFKITRKITDELILIKKKTLAMTF